MSALNPKRENIAALEDAIITLKSKLEAVDKIPFGKWVQDFKGAYKEVDLALLEVQTAFHKCTKGLNSLSQCMLVENLRFYEDYVKQHKA